MRISYYDHMNTPDTLGVGVIGLGFMGRTHIAAYKNIAECTVIAVADRDVGRHTGVATPEGNLDTSSDQSVFDPDQVDIFESGIDLILKSGIDLVSITTPTPTHIELAQYAIDHGRHVIIEKPISLCRSEIIKLDEKARQAGVLVMPAHCMRFWPAWVWMKRAVSDKDYGEVLSASFIRTGAAPGWNPDFYLDDDSSGGALVDLHIHDVDFILHLFGLPNSVLSRGTRRHVTTEYGFGPSGPKVCAEGGWLTDTSSPFTMKCTIECERGVIDFDLSRDPEIQVKRPDGSVDDHPEASEQGTGYDGEMAAMVHAVRSGATVPPVTLTDAADGMSIIEAELRSLELDQQITL